MRNEDILKYDNRFPPYSPKRGLADIDAFFAVAATVIGLPAENHRDAGRINRHGTDNGVIF